MSASLTEVDITIPEGSQPGDVLSIEVNGKMLEVSGTLMTPNPGQHAWAFRCPFLLASHSAL